MHPLILLGTYIAIAAAPLFLSWIQGLPPRSFGDEIASGLAMTAFAIILVEFVLSGRFRTISARIGMDQTMRFHQLIARSAVVFALVHPFFYRAPFFNAPLPWDMSRQYTLGLDAASLLSGLIVWALLPAFVLMAIFRDQLPYRYEAWRVMHAAGAALIALMTTHHTLAAGRYSADPLLAGFWFFLLAAALLSLLWVYLVVPLRQRLRPYEVTSVKRVALKTWELAVRPLRGEALAFQAGQFVWLTTGRSPFSRQEHPFSISSAPAERPTVRFLIKEMGDFTSQIGQVPRGSLVYLDGPYGNLTLERKSGTGIALIAGGVGIAPLLSIARQHHADGDPRPLILLYGNRSPEQIVYRRELTQMARRANTQVIQVVSEPDRGWKGRTGQLDRETIGSVFSFDGARDWVYLICGPPAMIEAVEEGLLDLGIPSGQILSELFYYT
ncbi:MAG: ferredoxin reductase family protein [Methyloligellaceae bacterium]